MLGLIERKKASGEHQPHELEALCRGLVAGDIPDYQVAAWLMAVCWRGMTPAETLALTRAMVATGEVLAWPTDRPVVDKHSTGGVGDKTSIGLVPLLSAAGLAFVKMSGRGLGHTGGTLDKLESIPGFSVELAPDRLRRQVAAIGCALVGQSGELVPADRALYALRDATATVDSVPLIASSIMSKKLAAGAGTIILDVKFGSGALLGERDDAEMLARTMVEIGEGAGLRVDALLNPMSEPLGRAVGNALEVREALEILHDGGPGDLRELTLRLGARLMQLSGMIGDEGAARRELESLLRSGAAARRMEELIEAQGGDPRVVTHPGLLPSAPITRVVTAGTAGRIAGIDARGVADAAVVLRAGRRRKDDAIDPSTGVRLLVHTGDRVERGAPLAELHAAREGEADAAEKTFRRALRFDSVAGGARE